VVGGARAAGPVEEAVGEGERAVSGRGLTVAARNLAAVSSSPFISLIKRMSNLEEELCVSLSVCFLTYQTLPCRFLLVTLHPGSPQT
jgi:hypothetical protein